MAHAGDVTFFEGTEKLLEVWFSSSNAENNKADLRIINRSCWEDLLKYANCEIISEKSDADMVSYVLSESSMFVSKKRFILKTCGTTTLLQAVKPLLKLAREICGMDMINDIFYSRKKFLKPELQAKVHRTFEDEMVHLDNIFDNGAAYALGRLNGESWYLYTTDAVGVVTPDQTLELLMEDLDPKIMKIFSMEVSKNGRDATEKSGISELIKEAIIDDFLFEPEGYSMNAILPGAKYFTIHVTPQPHCSYVSFETNVPRDSYHDLVKDLLNIFRPGKFLATCIANKSSEAVNAHQFIEKNGMMGGYKRTDHQFCQLKNYNITYAHYLRPVRPAPPIDPPF